MPAVRRTRRCRFCGRVPDFFPDVGRASPCNVLLLRDAVDLIRGLDEALLGAQPIPLELHIGVRVEALIDRAPTRRALEGGALVMVGGQWQVQYDFQPLNFPGWRIGHEFAGHDGHPIDRDILSFGDDADDGGHARGKSGGEQIRGRKRLAAAIVIDRGVGDEGAS